MDILKSLYPAPGTSELVEIRSTSNRALWDSITKALEGVPDEKNTVVLQVTKQDDGTNAVLVGKIGGHWSFAVGWDKQWKDHVLGARVAFSW